MIRKLEDFKATTNITSSDFLALRDQGFGYDNSTIYTITNLTVQSVNITQKWFSDLEEWKSFIDVKDDQGQEFHIGVEGFPVSGLNISSNVNQQSRDYARSIKQSNSLLTVTGYLLGAMPVVENHVNHIYIRTVEDLEKVS